MVKKRLLELALVALFLLLASLALWLTDADRLIFSLVPRDLSIAAVLPASSWAWPEGNLFPWNILYRWAAVPAVVIAAIALILLLISFVQQQYAPLRKQAVFVLLCIVLGPGLIINVLLKEQFGRARPREIVEFGGTHQFTQFWQPGEAGTNSSFPSGHAAIAFAAMTPWFVLRERRRRVAAGFLGLGLLFGSLVGVARILQGGHFPSDILWAGGLLYLLGGILALLMGIDIRYKEKQMKPQRRQHIISSKLSSSIPSSAEETTQ
jgi:membrane-associated PAP2 superfamily phosphatase